ncbi:MAG: hypothetical protein PVH96_14860 [Gemmatimonadota bacterium]
MTEGAADDEGLAQYLLSRSPLVSPELVRSYTERNATPLNLEQVVRASMGCQFRTDEQIQERFNTRDYWARVADAIDDPNAFPATLLSLVRLSRVGFDRETDRALVNFYSGSEAGTCYGQYLILERRDERWEEVDAVPSVIC